MNQYGRVPMDIPGDSAVDDDAPDIENLANYVLTEGDKDL